MEPFGSIEFDIEDLSTEVRIRYARRSGWVERILAPIAIPILVALGWFLVKPILVLAASGLTIILIVRWAWAHPSELRVLPDRLIATSYLTNPMEIPLSEIESIKWLPRDVLVKYSGPCGIYVSCASGPKCVLPMVAKEQAKAATDAISKRFPAYPIGAAVPGSTWFEAPLDN